VLKGLSRAIRREKRKSPLARDLPYLVTMVAGEMLPYLCFMTIFPPFSCFLEFKKNLTS
jgi:hypothetical protein